MIVKDRSLMKNGGTGVYPNIKCLYSTIPRDMRMHMHRVSKYAAKLLAECKKQGVWDDTLPEDIFTYAEELFRLHDIGRHYIPVDLYNKVEELSEQEREEIRNHTIYALRAEKSVYFPFFPEEIMPHFRDIATMHHERFDGKGYPYGKKGMDIPFLARVCAIADAYDGMVSWKPYRDSLSRDEAVERLQEASGSQFQPELVECFIKCKKEIELIELILNGE